MELGSDMEDHMEEYTWKYGSDPMRDNGALDEYGRQNVEEPGRWQERNEEKHRHRSALRAEKANAKLKWEQERNKEKYRKERNEEKRRSALRAENAKAQLKWEATKAAKKGEDGGCLVAYDPFHSPSTSKTGDALMAALKKDQLKRGAKKAAKKDGDGGCLVAAAPSLHRQWPGAKVELNELAQGKPQASPPQYFTKEVVTEGGLRGFQSRVVFGNRKVEGALKKRRKEAEQSAAGAWLHAEVGTLKERRKSLKKRWKLTLIQDGDEKSKAQLKREAKKTQLKKDEAQLKRETKKTQLEKEAKKTHLKKEAKKVVKEAKKARTVLGLTVGTYNLLHPVYAEKHREAEGICGKLKKSNWEVRAPEIGRILQNSQLDVVFLQEVGSEQLLDLSPYISAYQLTYVAHPGRSARDGVAVLTRRARLNVVATEPIAFEGKLPEHKGQSYMCAASAVVHDTHTDARLLLASVHFYPQKCMHPESTFLAHLGKARLERSCDCVVWGGDCNKVYMTPPGGGAYKSAKGDEEPTRVRGHKKIDWIFASSSGPSIERCAETEAFKQHTRHTILATGHPPSDHYGEAVVVTCLKNRIPRPDALKTSYLSLVTPLTYAKESSQVDPTSFSDH
jgi:hypothetical protein